MSESRRRNRKNSSRKPAAKAAPNAAAAPASHSHSAGSHQPSRNPRGSSISDTTSNATSTTSLGKRRSLARTSPGGQTPAPLSAAAAAAAGTTAGATGGAASGAHSPAANKAESQVADYGSQSSPMRVPETPAELTKVALLGAAGGIGQPLSMLLMLHSEYIQQLALFDVAKSLAGVAEDVSHIDRQCRVTHHESLAECVRDAKVVVVVAGLAQKPGMTRDDLFGTNAGIVFDLAKACAQHAPNAMLAIVSNPVNSLVPLANEVYAKLSAGAAKGGSDCSRRIFGVTTLDVVRASTFVARAFFKPDASGLAKDPSKVSVPVLGGHAGKTICPVLSQATPRLDDKALADEARAQQVIARVQEAGIEVLNKKAGAGSATLSMAYAACRFTIALLRAMQGETITECAYVKQPTSFEGLEYFSTPLQIAKSGWTKSLGVGKLLPFEQQMLAQAALELKTSVARGEDFATTRFATDAATAANNNNNNNSSSAKLRNSQEKAS